MPDPLHRLLETEARAQALVDRAQLERQQVIDEALSAARSAETKFESGRAALRAPFISEAQARADQAVADLSHQYAERQHMLRDLASRHESRAVEAALALLLDPAA